MSKDTKTLFITLEGIDGSGKSTLAVPLSTWLSEFMEKQIMITKEPFGQVPEFKSDESEYEWYMQDRKNHESNVIRPMLSEGVMIMCDRYIDSTYAYQIKGRHAVGEERLIADCMKYDFLIPDYTILLDLPVIVAAKRIAERDGKELSDNEMNFLKKVNNGYRLIAEWEFQKGSRIIVIDATKDINEVLKEAKNSLEKRLVNDGYQS